MGILGALDLILWRTQIVNIAVIPSLLYNHRSAFQLIARDKKNQCILYKSKHYFITKSIPIKQATAYYNSEMHEDIESLSQDHQLGLLHLSVSPSLSLFVRASAAHN